MQLVPIHLDLYSFAQDMHIKYREDATYVNLCQEPLSDTALFTLLRNRLLSELNT
jgi:hypothetical protein